MVLYVLTCTRTNELFGSHCRLGPLRAFHYSLHPSPEPGCPGCHGHLIHTCSWAQMVHDQFGAFPEIFYSQRPPQKDILSE